MEEPLLYFGFVHVRCSCLCNYDTWLCGLFITC